MRTILLSSAVILGLASHASAVNCPPAAKVSKALRSFLGNLDQLQAFNQTLDTKLKIKTSDTVLITSLLLPDLEEKKSDGNRCNYGKKGSEETAIQFTIK